ncbi:ATP-binding cassette domain-containing protein [Shimia sp. R11_0]|uniref:ATP-binding cassette domain-containing protein n=1 Tax=Shimia sp. R11_0 TaxID=2821096 RepID=UPI001ADB1054|nr:ATP-binding cassette domain-containing protein [Shimia sp. R11_0]MBO9477768.1 ATP-binding cassette domain-containing protein [Shimia sp. R11_0]
MGPVSALSPFAKMVPLLLGLSAVSNLAVLINPIFMMQVLDRVLPTGNLHTLALLLLIAALALLLQAVVDGLRDSSFYAAAGFAERSLAPLILQTPLVDRVANLQELKKVVRFLRGPAAIAALSLPWLPLFLAVLWLIHPWFVALTSGLICLSAALRLTTSAMSKAPETALAQARTAEDHATENAQQFSQSIGVPGMADNLRNQVVRTMRARSRLEDRLTPFTTQSAALSGFLRAMGQLLGLSLGAMLVVQDALSAGGMIAASLILIKTVTSFETVVTTWPDISAAKSAYMHLKSLAMPRSNAETHISKLSGALRCDGLIFPRAGGAAPRLERVSFALPAGSCTAIVGASGSGKSTLLEALSGLAPCPIGTVWLEDTEIKTLPVASHTAHIGYLPQQAQLFAGTLAQNIAGFAPEAADEDIITAAKMAGVHGLISALPQSYDTDIGATPHVLSAGQKQRVALARAIFHEPQYLFLDEPNALLDAAGERQLCAVLARLRKQGITIVMVIHRSGLMGLADHVVALENGRLADFGSRSEVLGRMSGGRRRIDLPLRHDSLQDLVDWVGAQFTRGNDAELSTRTELIASELFNLARASGPQDEPRTVSFAFRFLSDHSCEVTVTENRITEAARKMEKVTRLMLQPETDMGRLPGDEAALAVIAQLSDSFDIDNVAGQATYRAAVSMRPVALQGGLRH